MPKSGSIASCVAVLLALCAPAVVRADGLSSLVGEYRAACTKVGGAAKSRGDKVDKHVRPVLEKIAALDSDDSLKWLATEIDNAKVLPEIRAAMAAPILKHSSDRAVDYLLRGLMRRPEPVQEAVADALRRTERKLDAAEENLVRAVGPQLASSARASFARVFGKLDSLGGLKALLRSMGSSRRKSSGGGDRDLQAAIVSSYRKSKSAAIKTWLAEEGVSSVASVAERLAVVVELIGELKVVEARDDLETLVSHRSSDVSSAAIEALSKIGLGDTAEKIAKVIEKGRGGLEAKIKALDALAASGEAGAIASVIKASKSRDPETRAVAMGSLALAPKSTAAMDALLAGLKDRDSSVRNVALRAIGRVRYKPMVAALIDAMGTTRDPSFQVKVLETLATVTGQNMGLVTEDWTKWWDFNKAEFEFPTGEAEGATKQIARDLSYFGIEVSSKRLGFLVDISSSMRQVVPVKEGSLEEDEDETGGGRTKVRKRKKKGDDKVKDGKAMKIDVLKRELTRLLKKLPSDTALNIICFDATYKAWQKKLQPLYGRGRSKAVDYVQNLNTGSGTNVFDTLEFALKDKRVDTIYLLTDGVPTRGRIKNPDAILAEIRKQNRVRAVTIHTIAFGEKSALLEKLAAENGGQYRFVDRY